MIRLQMINQTKEVPTAHDSANAAGISNVFLVSSKVQEWIIDTGATNHGV